MGRSARAVTFVPLVAFVAIYISFFHPPWPAYRVVGFVLSLIGLGFLTAARLSLGDSFSVAPEARKLVTTGLYSKVRHPVYVFSLLAIAGLLLYLDKPWFCLIVISIAIMQVFRARAE